MDLADDTKDDEAIEEELDQATLTNWRAWLEEQKGPFPEWMYGSHQKEIGTSNEF